ncbi:hypothetical protein CONPUDRAFT_145814 [Coniophora puteana RWD-64-598 SS2]|uniref:Uncharacterized protein n=1 Tax=Coniophora puteana (strain RWD-64-598) TaxID=741705 RepID=A0A5M3MHK3_CONPW|nr:uncharacterized protein CONPUDRAFT_145814 [Coniophora puteana RWD-64-598 SS2]EIW78682.1 hypothetical protein CONPUDRAFT_145814 [Coniophora puteana RWD-64-598 SS2]
MQRLSMHAMDRGLPDGAGFPNTGQGFGSFVMTSTTLPLVRSALSRINQLLRMACSWVFRLPSTRKAKGAYDTASSPFPDSVYDQAEQGNSPYQVTWGFEHHRRLLVKARKHAESSPFVSCLQASSSSPVSPSDAPIPSDDCFTSTPIRPAHRQRRFAANGASPLLDSLPPFGLGTRRLRNLHLERVKAINPGPDFSPMPKRRSWSSDMSPSSSVSSLFDDSDGDSVATLDTEAEEECCIDDEVKSTSPTESAASDVVETVAPTVGTGIAEARKAASQTSLVPSIFTSCGLSALAIPEAMFLIKPESVFQAFGCSSMHVNIHVNLFFAASSDSETNSEPEPAEENSPSPVDDWVRVVLTSPPPPQPPSPQQQQLDSELDEIEAMLNELGAQVKDWNAEMREVLSKGKHMLFEL